METSDTKSAVDGAPAAATAKRRFRPVKVLKIATMAVVLSTAALYVASGLWTISGSNRWELSIDQDGTQVYTLKSPGSTMLKVKGVTQSKEFTLSNHLAPFFDESIQNNCGEWVAGCLSYKVLKSFDSRTQRNVTMWTVSLPPPFAPREFVLQGQLSLDPKTNTVVLQNIAVPNVQPRNDCCVRLEHVHNVWYYTPLADGAIRVEFLSDMDMGGNFPKLLLNIGAPAAIHKMLTQENPRLLRQARYRSATLDLDFLRAGAENLAAAR